MSYSPMDSSFIQSAGAPRSAAEAAAARQRTTMYIVGGVIAAAAVGGLIYWIIMMQRKKKQRACTLPSDCTKFNSGTFVSQCVNGQCSEPVKV